MSHPSGNPSGEQLVERARVIAARLTDRGPAAEAAGRLPDSTIAEVIEADLMRSTVPKRFGGLETDFRYVPEIQRALGAGCLATAWTIGILIQHNYQIGFYSEEAQQEIWANGPNTFAPGYIIPGGTATPAPGGYRLNGHWRFGSGFPHGHWILLSAAEIVNGETGPVRRFALPIGDVTPQNNWQVSGLAATGTWDCLLDDCFVPTHRSILAKGMLDGTAPGIATNPGPLWRIPLMAFYYPNMSAMMLGAAEGVARIATDLTRRRVLSYGGAKAADIGYVRANIGKSTVRLNAVGALLDAEIARVERAAETRASLPLAARVGVRTHCTYVVKEARAVVNDLCDQAGTSAFFTASPLQRFHREMNVLSSHAFYDYDRAATVYGQAILEGAVPEGEFV